MRTLKELIMNNQIGPLCGATVPATRMGARAILDCVCQPQCLLVLAGEETTRAWRLWELRWTTPGQSLISFRRRLTRFPT